MEHIKTNGKFSSFGFACLTRKMGMRPFEMLSTLMQQQNLSSQLKPRDEFTQHNSDSLKLIQQVVSEFKQISQNEKKYSQVSIMLGSALSSTGDLKKAESLFNEVLAKSSVKAEQALAHFNLFQVQLRSNNVAVNNPMFWFNLNSENTSTVKPIVCNICV